MVKGVTRERGFTNKRLLWKINIIVGMCCFCVLSLDIIIFEFLRYIRAMAHLFDDFAFEAQFQDNNKFVN